MTGKMSVMRNTQLLIKTMFVVIGVIFIPATTEREVLDNLCKSVDVDITIGQFSLKECSNNKSETSENSFFLKTLSTIFSKHGNWSRLSISDTHLPEIPDFICQLKELEILELNKNELKILTNDCFIRLKNIEIIRITNNFIERVENGLFDGLLKLRELNFNYNYISYIGTYVFSDVVKLPSLLKISIADNRLESIDPWPIIRGTSLNHTKIDVGSNRISKFTNNLNWYYNCSMRKKYGYNFQYILRDNMIMHLNDFFGSIFKTDVDILCLRGKKFHTDVSIVIDDYNPFVCDCVDYNYLNKISMIGRSNFMSLARCAKPINNKRWMSLRDSDMICNETNVSCIKDCSCYKESKAYYTIICSNLKDLTDKLPSRNLTTKYHNPYKLLFSGSKISKVHNHDYFRNVKWLDLSKNRIATITKSAFKSILTIPIVYLHSNNLTTLPHIDVEVKSKSLSLHGNQWDCSCENVWLKHWLEKLRDKNILLEPDSIYCQSPNWLEDKNIFKIDEKDFCKNPNTISTTSTLLKILLPSIIIAALIVIICLLVRKFKVQLNTYLNIHPLDKDECEGEDMEYDAFISCSYLDRHRAIELVQMLESRGFHICYHEKDFIGGVSIAANIQHAIIKSKRVICLLSDDFFRSSYCVYEFQSALQRNTYLNKERLIALIVNTLNLDCHSIPGEIHNYLKTHTYIDYDKSTKCFNQLMYSLPVKKLGMPKIF